MYVIQKSTNSKSSTASSAKRRETTSELPSFLGQFSSDITVAGNKKEEDDEENFILKKRRKGLKCLRIVAGTGFIALTVITTTVVYSIMKMNQNDNFESDFNTFARTLSDGIQRHIDISVWSARVLAETYEGRFASTNTWPNVTLNNFFGQTEGLLNISKAQVIGFNPLVYNYSTRIPWEKYAKDTTERLYGSSVVVREGENYSWTVSDGVYRIINSEPVYDPGYTPKSRFPYMLTPIWQVSPINTNIASIMFNQHSELERRRAIDDAVLHRVATLSSFVQLIQSIEFKPTSLLFYPIFNSTATKTINTAVVGLIQLGFAWETALSDILDTDVDGVICVIHDSTGTSFTYVIHGPSVFLLGEGDLHDLQYNHLVYDFNVSIATEFHQYAGVENLVTYSVYIYPSETFQATYLNRWPIRLAGSIFAIFLLVSPLFFLYDYLLNYHIYDLANSAAKSDRIIRNLFPNVVRDRLFKMNEEKSQLKNVHSKSRNHHRPRIILPVAKQIRDFLSLDEIQGKKNESERLIMANDEPIADHFDSTTIMFADIAGFTSWSSKHQPQQVFRLLESLFGEFDNAAKKLGVFKVETIGDCYVAVCGLPELRPDHAVVMSQFALVCQRKFNKVVKNLQDIDAHTLKLRSGLHSGPITGGILRGEKSRFQLFGDTINTASRMESTGEPARVQISQQTKELLCLAKKNDWFEPRDGLVTAKGKGALQTFWLFPDAHIRDMLNNHLPTSYTQTSKLNYSTNNGEAKEGENSDSDIRSVTFTGQTIQEKQEEPKNQNQNNHKNIENSKVAYNYREDLFKNTLTVQLGDSTNSSSTKQTFLKDDLSTHDTKELIDTLPNENISNGKSHLQSDITNSNPSHEASEIIGSILPKSNENRNDSSII